MCHISSYLSIYDNNLLSFCLSLFYLSIYRTLGYRILRMM